MHSQITDILCLCLPSAQKPCINCINTSLLQSHAHALCGKLPAPLCVRTLDCRRSAHLCAFSERASECCVCVADLCDDFAFRLLTADWRQFSVTMTRSRFSGRHQSNSCRKTVSRRIGVTVVVCDAAADSPI